MHFSIGSVVALQERMILKVLPQVRHAPNLLLHLFHQLFGTFSHKRAITRHTQENDIPTDNTFHTR